MVVDLARWVNFLEEPSIHHHIQMDKVKGRLVSWIEFVTDMILYI